MNSTDPQTEKGQHDHKVILDNNNQFFLYRRKKLMLQ